MNEKGQGEAVFRLLIDSVVGMAILLIIISMISYFNNQVIEQSRVDLINSMNDAVSSPDGKIVKTGDLTFAKGFVVNQAFAQDWTGQGAKCFSFDARGASLNILTKDGVPAGVQFTQNLTIQVNIQCKSSSNANSCNPKIAPETEADCCFTCLIAFGKDIK
ncbi:MAG: hypothetical protein WCI04_00875 [archaeon]